MSNTFQDTYERVALAEWHASVLHDAALFLTNSAQREFQEKVGLWVKNSNIPYPGIDDVSIHNNGCMWFTVLGKSINSGGYFPIKFSVWMTIGEVRIGVKIPIRLIGQGATEPNLASLYDGKTCSRNTIIDSSYFFDWIFSEGFAHFDFMSQAPRNSMYSAILSRRIGEILTHVYVTCMVRLVETEGLGAIVLRKEFDGFENFSHVTAGGLDADPVIENAIVVGKRLIGAGGAEIIFSPVNQKEVESLLAAGDDNALCLGTENGAACKPIL